MRPALLPLLLAAATAPSLAQEPPPAPAPVSAPAAAPGPEPYLRTREEADGVLVLEAATRVLARPDGRGPRIHLVSAIHVADASFYAGAQARLDALELVLFEGVKPAGAGAIPPDASPERRAKATLGRLGILRSVAERAREGGGAFPGDLEALVAGAGKRGAAVLRTLLVDGWGRPLRYERRAGPPETAVFASDGPDGRPDSAGGPGPGDDLRVEAVAEGKAPAAAGGGLQEDLARALGLAFQGDAMDPARPNWRGSDMSIDELQERMDAAGADATELLALLDGTSVSARMARALLGMVGRIPKMAAMVKMVMVEALASAPGGGMAAGSNMAKVMKVVIEDRNGVVLADLRGILEAEPGRRDVAVWYGAGHMEDLERRIVAGLGYRAGETTWAAAVRADPREAGFTPEQARQLRATMRKMIERRLEGK